MESVNGPDKSGFEVNSFRTHLCIKVVKCASSAFRSNRVSCLQSACACILVRFIEKNSMLVCEGNRESTKVIHDKERYTASGG